MTSNIGADLIKGGVQFGFGKKSDIQDYDKMKSTLLKEIERYFRPEFINRLDEVIVFHPLTREDLVQIVDYETKKVRHRLESHGLVLEIDQTAKDFLIEKGYNPDFGARPLRRAIGTYIEDALSESILRGEFEGKNLLRVIHAEEAEHLTFTAEYREDLDEAKKKADAKAARAEGSEPVGSGSGPAAPAAGSESAN